MKENFTVYMEDVTIDSTTEILTLIQLIYGIPSILLMIFCTFLVALGKKYRKSTFYVLVLFDLITVGFLEVFFKLKIGFSRTFWSM